MNIENAKIAIDKMAFFIPEDVLNDLYKDHSATAEVLAQDENRVVFSIVYHDKKEKRILSITVKRNEINVHYNGTMEVFSQLINAEFYSDIINVLFPEDEKTGDEMKLNKIEIQIPFSGFYYSIHDMYIDNHIECEIEYLESELDYTEDQLEIIKDRFYVMDYAPIRKAICEHYINAFNAVFYDEYDIHLDLEYSKLISPKFYNFETDRLYAFIDESIFNEVTALINTQDFKAMLKDKFKRRDGFIPFQSTLDAIDNNDTVLFSAEVLEQLLPEETIINNYQYSDNINEVVSNACNVDYEL